MNKNNYGICRGEIHTKEKKNKYLCINLECDLHAFCCRECEKELHSKHREDCIDLEKGYQNKLSNMLQTQEKLREKLNDMLRNVTKYFQSSIKNLDSNIDSIYSLQQDKYIREDKVDSIKYYNSFENIDQKMEGNQLEQELIKFERCAESLDYILQQQLKPAVKCEIKGLKLMEKKKWKDALLSFEKAQKYQNSSPKLYAYKAEALRHLKQYDEAWRNLEEGQRIATNDSVFLVEQGYLLKKKKKYDDALVIFKKSLNQDDSQNTKTIYGTGMCLLKLKKFQEAHEQFDSILKNLEKEKQKSDIHVKSLIGLANSLAGMNQIDDAEKHFEQVVLMKESAKIYVQYGNLFCKNNISRCGKFYDKAIYLDSKYIEAYLAKLRSNLIISPQQALLIADRILNDLDKENSEALMYKGMFLSDKGQYAEAEQLLIKVFQKTDLKPQVKLQTLLVLMNNCAIILRDNKLTNYKLLSSIINQLQEFKYEDMEIHYQMNLNSANVKIQNFGIVLYEKSFFNEAFQVFDRIKEGKEKNPVFYNFYCKSLFKTKKYPQAMQVFNLIIEKKLVIDNWTVQILSDSLFEQQDFDIALKVLDKLKACKVEECPTQLELMAQAKYISYNQFRQTQNSIPNNIKSILLNRIEGNILLQQKQPQKALEFYKKFIKEVESLKIEYEYNYYKEPSYQALLNPATVYINMSKALINLGDSKAAIETINKAQMLNLNLSKELEEESSHLKSEALLKLDEKEKAKYREEMSSELGKQFQKQIDRATILKNENKLDEARKCFEQALSLKGEGLEDYLDQCEDIYKKCVQSGDFTEIVNWVDVAIRIGPENQRIYKIQIAIFTKRIEKLIEIKQYNEAIELLDNSQKSKEEIGIADLLEKENWYFKIGKIINILGQQLFNTGQYEIAEKAFDRHIESNKGNINNCVKNAYFLLSLTLYQLKKYNLANEKLEELYEIANFETVPDQIKILQCDTLFRQKDYNKAYLEYHTALESSKDYKYNINLGDCQIVQKKGKRDNMLFKKANYQYEKAITEGKKYNDQECINKAKLHQGYALYLNDQLEDSQIILKEVIKNDEKRKSAYFFLTLVKALDGLKKFDEANDYKKKAHNLGLEIDNEEQPLLEKIELTSDNVKEVGKQLPFK